MLPLRLSARLQFPECLTRSPSKSYLIAGESMQSSLLLATPRLCSSVAWATVPFRRARAIVSVGVRTSSRSNRPPYSTTRFSTNTGSKTAGSNSPASGPGADANDDPLSAPQDQRILHVAVAGLPNAGKSTLVNLMVGDKVSRHISLLCDGLVCSLDARLIFHVQYMMRSLPY